MMGIYLATNLIYKANSVKAFSWLVHHCACSLTKVQTHLPSQETNVNQAKIL